MSINFEVREVDAQAANDGHLCGLAPSDLHCGSELLCLLGYKSATSMRTHREAFQRPNDATLLALSFKPKQCL